MYCRGKEKREEIIRDYIVEPVAHIQLLKGQTKQSDAQAKIENDYYVFKVISREKGDVIDTILCGMGAARHFLELLHHEGLPLFNPLQGDGAGGAGGNGGDGGDGIPRQNWNPLARQLYYAIMWVITLLDADPDSTIYKVKDEVYNRRGIAPGKNIKSVNTIIRRNIEMHNFGDAKTLTEAINKCRQQNRLRDNMCQFELIQEAIENMTDKDGNPIQSFF